MKFVYIIYAKNSSKKFWGRDSIYYTGVTSNPAKRLWEHINNKDSEFLSKHSKDSAKHLVYIEIVKDDQAIKRQKTIKNYTVLKKENLIKTKRNILLSVKASFNTNPRIWLRNGMIFRREGLIGQDVELKEKFRKETTEAIYSDASVDFQ